MTEDQTREIEFYRKELLESVFIDDKFAWIILSMKRDYFTTNPRILHSSFYELRKRHEELDDITFLRANPPV